PGHHLPRRPGRLRRAGGEPPRRGRRVRRAARPRGGGDGVRIQNVLRIAARAIRRNKIRSILTMLGVIIGVASVIAMIALGSGARAAIDEQIQSQGTNVIYVSAGSFGRGPGAVRQGAGSVSTLTLEDAQAIAQQVGM